MKVHLIKSSEISQELFTEVLGLLNAIPGPFSFLFDRDSVVDFDKEDVYPHIIKDIKEFTTVEKSFSCELESISFPFERNTASWATLFGRSDSYRRGNRIPESEFVILLTDVANEKNWFASLDERMPCNGFIHTADWSHYIDCSSAFPIAYEVIALTLQRFMFEGFDDLNKVHFNPIGCINDFCMQKREIILKLRTADICRDCMSRVKDKLPMPIIHHALQIMESLRVKMLYAQNFRQDSPLSNLVIRQNRIFLPDFGNIEIKLRPLEKALYFLFLNHPEGILMSSLSEHRRELYDIYTGISNTGMMHEMKARIDDMVNFLSNSASEKISRIKKVFEDSIGRDLAEHYYIKGANREAKAISLNRNNVERG